MTSKQYLDIGGFLTVNFGYGIGLMVALYASIGVSGGHLNPAVTLAMALRGKTSWFKVPIVDMDIKLFCVHHENKEGSNRQRFSVMCIHIASQL